MIILLDNNNKHSFKTLILINNSSNYQLKIFLKKITKLPKSLVFLNPKLSNVINFNLLIKTHIPLHLLMPINLM